MDQNRCLLDVIDNPQLLQSFLESETSADTAVVCNSSSNVSSINPATNFVATVATNAITNNTSTDTSYQPPSSTPFISHSNISDAATPDATPQSAPSNSTLSATSQDHRSATFMNNSFDLPPRSEVDDSDETSGGVDPVFSVLNSIIKETVAEASPSTNQYDYSDGIHTSDAGVSTVPPTTCAPPVTYSTSCVESSSFDPSRSNDVNNTHSSSPALDTTPSYHGIGTGDRINFNDANNNSTSSSDNGSNELLVDEFYSQNLQANVVPTVAQPTENQADHTLSVKLTPDINSTSPDNTSITISNTQTSVSPKSMIGQHQPPKSEQKSNPDQQQSQQLDESKQFETHPQAQHQEQQSTVSSDDKSNQSSTADVKVNTPSITPKPTPKANIKTSENKPKRNTSRAKKPKTTTVTTTPTQSPSTPTNLGKPMQTQFISTAPGQQQVIFQNNNGIRQQAMLAPTSIGQPMVAGGMPQPQRVIQIQTANGPMYFAIAPGPAASINNNGMMTQPQPGMQSQQFPSQQICFQPNNTMMMSRPQTMSPMNPQRQQNPNQQQPPQQQSNQQQHHPQIQSPQPHQQQVSSGNMMVTGPQILQNPHQQRLGSPMMAGQTIAIANQQNPHQQQQIMLPSSQPMMMPRMPNQIILNRPMGSTGQILPGQQQFIQILTPNGPMLLALPPQPSQTQPVNNTMIDYNSQVQPGQPARQLQHMPVGQPKSFDITDSSNNATPPKQTGANSAKNAANSKSGLDLGDLLMDCGIIPDDKTASQSSSSIKSSQSPSLSQISSPMPSLSQTNSPMPSTEQNSFSTNHHQNPHPMPSYGQYQGQPVRISLGPDGQMIMQPALYSTIRPSVTGSMGQSPQINMVAPGNMIPSGSPMISMSSPSPSTPNPNNQQTTPADNKKATAKGKATAVKRSRSKKSDIDKFPQLKTPKLTQQQQLPQQQQQKPTVVVPMSYIVGDQSKVMTASSDVKSNVAQLASGQQVSLAKFVTPVMQSSPLGSNMMQSNVPQTNLIAPAPTNVVGQSQPQIINPGQFSAQIIQTPGMSISTSTFQQSQLQQQQQNSMTTSTSSSTTHLSSSGNVTTNFLKGDIQTRTVESNPHISSSLMPTISLTVDNSKIEQNGLKTNIGPIQTQSIKGLIHNVGGITTTLVLRPTQVQLHHNQSIQNQAQLQQQQLQQQLVRQRELRVQGILNQLNADQNAALHPQTKQAFKSLEDACKRLLRYHVFDTETVGEDKIRKVDEIFEAAVESLLSRKQAIYDKFRFLILKQSMKTVPSNEEVMLDQIFVNDELAYLKKERELFREYEAHLESISIEQARDFTRTDSAEPDSFGRNSLNQNDQDNATHSRDVDDWLINDKWGDSRYPSVPDSEAATAIESILNEQIN